MSPFPLFMSPFHLHLPEGLRHALFRARTPCTQVRESKMLLPLLFFSFPLYSLSFVRGPEAFTPCAQVRESEVPQADAGTPGLDPALTAFEGGIDDAWGSDLGESASDMDAGEAESDGDAVSDADGDEGTSADAAAARKGKEGEADKSAAGARLTAAAHARDGQTHRT